MIAIRTTVLLYTLVTLLLAWLLATSADASPFGMLLAFAPRWWLLLPWALLLPASLLDRWPAVITAAAGTLITLFAVVHFELPALRTGSEPRDLRVVSYNTDLREAVADSIRADLREWDADVVLLQDCKTIVADSLRAIAQTIVTPLAVHVHGRFCIVSRWPVRQAVDISQLVDPRSKHAGVLRSGESGMRYVVRTLQGDIPIYSVHLPSPREALGIVRWMQTTDRAKVSGSLTQSINERAAASAAFGSVARREPRQAIVAGDFNLPYGSQVLRRDWKDFTNVFAHVGTGLGYTMQAGVFSVRIDHILTTRNVTPIASRVLSGYPSEHQPLLADIILRER
jgi:endonuclease/exonuclease/phosphatase (EEP) superfamily protein YafD